MKRVLSIIISLIMLIAIVGCTNKAPKEEPKTQENVLSDSQTEETTATTYELKYKSNYNAFAKNDLKNSTVKIEGKILNNKIEETNGDFISIEVMLDDGSTSDALINVTGNYQKDTLEIDDYIYVVGAVGSAGNIPFVMPISISTEGFIE